MSVEPQSEDLRHRPRNTDKQRAELSKALTEIPDAYTLLALFRLPGSRPPDPDRRIGTTSPARPPLNLDVLDLEDAREKRDAPATRDYQLDRMAGARRQGVLPTLSSWVRLIDGGMWDCGEEHQPPAEQPTVVGECEWLKAQLEWVVEQEWVGEFDNDIHKLLSDIKRAVGEAIRRPYQPRCPWCKDRILGEGPTGVDWFRCAGCGRTWVLDAEIGRLNKTQPPMSLQQCADVTGIPLRTLYNWEDRGLFKAVGRDRWGKLFDLEHVKIAREQVAV